MTERFKTPAIHQAVGKLVRSNSLAVLDTPEALRFLVGDKLDTGIRRDLKVLTHFAALLLG